MRVAGGEHSGQEAKVAKRKRVKTRKVEARSTVGKGLIDNTHKMMKSSARSGVQFLLQKDVPKEKKWVFGDDYRIQQELTNVVTNAIKYTLQGSITLQVSWTVDSLMQLECIDTGPGTPKSKQENLFEWFVHRGGAPQTGLGLNIAKEIVTIFGGTIKFESDPTVKPGTTCHILLPLELCGQQPDEEVQAMDEAKPMITQKEKEDGCATLWSLLKKNSGYFFSFEIETSACQERRLASRMIKNHSQLLYF
jgi:anti-sigma regulatory factor (Ser/Thr protein kinase)